MFIAGLCVIFAGLELSSTWLILAGVFLMLDA